MLRGVWFGGDRAGNRRSRHLVLVSAVALFGVLMTEKTDELDRYYPTAVLITGYDIIFFWVARMMFAGQFFMGQVPFKDVYINALIRDKHGQKMSKTKGNVVDPLEVIDKWGADAFQFTLAAMAGHGRDILWDGETVEGYHRFTTKIWQSLRFTNMNSAHYDANAPVEYGLYDHWIRARLALLWGGSEQPLMSTSSMMPRRKFMPLFGESFAIGTSS